MNQLTTVDNTLEDIYAVLDLGSNSFHMMITRVTDGGVQVIGLVKRKVRLAAGLDDNNTLNQEAMERGWECLALFAERLQDIPNQNIRIVGTATLRLASNVDVFLERANKILGNDIRIISGEEEAKTIYLGVAHTSNCESNRLVIDIGGASTEVVIGSGFNPLHYKSLSMGCVIYLERYFADEALTVGNFDAAIEAASDVVRPFADDYFSLGWQSSVGASGTVQAIREILIAQGFDEVITLARLENIMEQAIACKSIKSLKVKGLIKERQLVFPSGLAILIALFKTLKITSMTLAGGALREGVLYSMLPNMQQQNIRERTLNGLVQGHNLDREQGERVASVAVKMAEQLCEDWELKAFDGIAVLRSAAMLHELGVMIEFKRNHHHGAYILTNMSLPGFTSAQEHLLTALVYNYRQDIDPTIIQRQTLTSVVLAERLTRILRVAVILSLRRRDEGLPEFTVRVKDETLQLCLPAGWLHQHPLMRSELESEIEYQCAAGWTLQLV